MLKLVLATRNRGKIKEIRDKLNEYSVVIECLADYPQIPEIEETGKTFADNATIKAKTAAEWTNLPALADDSGLEIEYLDQKPGIHSSRWGKTDWERIDKVLRKLHNIKGEQRVARFICVMSLFISNQQTYTTIGSCSGRISLLPQGNSGFGYDPIFIPDGYERTFSQLGVEIKNRISHRAIALEKMLQIILNYFKIK